MSSGLEERGQGYEAGLQEWTYMTEDRNWNTRMRVWKTREARILSKNCAIVDGGISLMYGWYEFSYSSFHCKGEMIF